MSIRFFIYAILYSVPTQFFADLNAKNSPDWFIYPAYISAAGFLILPFVSLTLSIYGLRTFSRTSERGRWAAIVIIGLEGIFVAVTLIFLSLALAHYFFTGPEI
jgi:hypothetical protein